MLAVETQWLFIILYSNQWTTIFNGGNHAHWQKLSEYELMLPENIVKIQVFEKNMKTEKIQSLFLFLFSQ